MYLNTNYTLFSNLLFFTQPLLSLLSLFLFFSSFNFPMTVCAEGILNRAPSGKLKVIKVSWHQESRKAEFK